VKNTINVTIWNEYRHEKEDEKIRAVYPRGIHNALAEYLISQPDFNIRTATLDQPDHGLGDDVIAGTDVLLWWDHIARDEVRDDIVEKLRRRILLDGMGLIALHSGHQSKIFTRMLGTSGRLKWREAGEKERVWVVEPGHPIAAGAGEYFEIPHEETYGERFDIPAPDNLVFISWFSGGEVIRSGCCYYRGKGKIFYFRPGHEEFPTFYMPVVRRVLCNAIRWAAPDKDAPHVTFGEYKPLEN